MLRVLITDDSPTARELIQGILGADPGIEIVGCATNGAEAVRLTDELHPDVVTMDIHMPVLNGLEATAQIMAQCPTPIVIVSATTLVHDVEWAMSALQAGALTLLMKPSGPNTPGFDAAAKELVETVKAMAGVKVVRRRDRAAPRAQFELQVEPEVEPSVTPAVTRGIRVIAMAASTGGPPALLKILSCLPADFPVPVLIVQHIASGFTEGFVTWLDVALPLSVKMAEQHERLRGGVVYVAPENQHLGVAGGRQILLSDAGRIGGFRPSATHLFESVGRMYHKQSIGVILTGMGNDGVDGLCTLKSSGGHVIAQDEQSSVVFGMPGEANKAGIVDALLPLDQICDEIMRIVGAGVIG